MSDDNDFNPETDLEFIIDIKLKEEIAKKTKTNGPQDTNVIKSSSSLIFFDLNNQFFKFWISEIGFNFNHKIVTDLKELTLELKSQDKVVLVFNYSLTPKTVEQLIPQIKAKFSHVRVVIIGQTLSNEDIVRLKGANMGVHSFLKLPCSLQDFIDVIS